MLDKKKENKENPLCLRPGCGKPAHIRGLCRCCYGSALLLVKKGVTTWEDLESKGKANRRFKNRVGAAHEWLLS